MFAEENGGTSDLLKAQETAGRLFSQMLKSLAAMFFV